MQLMRPFPEVIHQSIDRYALEILKFYTQNGKIELLYAN